MVVFILLFLLSSINILPLLIWVMTRKDEICFEIYTASIVLRNRWVIKLIIWDRISGTRNYCPLKLGGYDSIFSSKSSGFLFQLNSPFRKKERKKQLCFFHVKNKEKRNKIFSVFVVIVNVRFLHLGEH